MTHFPCGPSPEPDRSTLSGMRLQLRPATDEEVQQLAEAIAADEEANPWWGSDAEKIAGWLSDPRANLFAIVVNGEIAGAIMYEEETDPDYKFAGIDITLLSPWIGKGYGREALVTLARHLFEDRGHHRIQIDPAAANDRAIQAYERVGFKPVGIMRRYERGPDGKWRDALLMDLLPEELASA